MRQHEAASTPTMLDASDGGGPKQTASSLLLEDPMIEYNQMQRSLVRQRRVLRRSNVISKTLYDCAGTIGLRHFLADKNNHHQAAQERRGHVEGGDLEPDPAGASLRDRFLKKCSDLFCKYAECHGAPLTPIDMEEDVRFMLKVADLEHVVDGLDGGCPQMQQELRRKLSVQPEPLLIIDGEPMYGPSEFMKLCLELCPYPPPASPRHKGERDNKLPAQGDDISGGATGAKGQSRSVRERVNPDVVVAAVKVKARRERKQQEVRRWVTSIFERLYQADTQRKRVHASVRPDLQDPFVKCGRVRVQGIYQRKKREEWDHIARNLSSTMDLMAHHFNKDRCQRKKETEARRVQKRAALLRQVMRQGKQQVTAQRQHTKDRKLQSATQWRRELQDALQQVSNAAADRVEAVRRSRSVFHLSDFTSSAISADPEVAAKKKGTTKLSEFKKCQKEERQKAAQIRSQRLRQWRDKARGAYAKAMQDHVVLPYVGGSHKVMDGEQLFVLPDPDVLGGPVVTSPRAESSRLGQWRTRSRDPELARQAGQDDAMATRPPPRNKDELPFAMRAAERVYGEKQVVATRGSSSRHSIASSGAGGRRRLSSIDQQSSRRASR